MDDGAGQKDFYKGEVRPADIFVSTRRDPASPNGDIDSEGIAWSASEFIDHQKNVSWFALMAVAAVIVAMVVYLATKDAFGPVIIGILAVIFGAGAARRPRVLQYALDASGLRVGDKHYPYELFRAFALMQEGPVESILLLPTKRWNPALSIYYAPEDADKIINTLGSFVPLEDRKLGYIDKFLHKIRF